MTDTFFFTQGFIDGGTGSNEDRQTPTVPELLIAQAGVSAPLPGDLASGTNLVSPPLRTADRFAHFPEDVYLLTAESHLVKFVKVLLGDAGAGQLRKFYLLQRFRATLNGAHFLDLDRFYGALFGFRRLNYEALALGPGDVGTSDDWVQEEYKNASYRSRIAQFTRAIPYGPSPVGMEAAAEAVLATDVNVIETFAIADEAPASYGGIEDTLGTYEVLNVYTYGELEGLDIATGLPVPDRRMFLVVPSEPVTEEERYACLRVLDRLKPVDALMQVLANALPITEETKISHIDTDSEFWQVIPHVTPVNFTYTIQEPAAEQPKPPFCGYLGEAWNYMADISAVSSYSEKHWKFGKDMVPDSGPPARGKRNIDPTHRFAGPALTPEEVPYFYAYIGLGLSHDIDMFGQYFHPVDAADAVRWVDYFTENILPGIREYTLHQTTNFMVVTHTTGTYHYTPDKAVVLPQEALAGRVVSDGILASTTPWDPDVMAVTTTPNQNPKGVYIDGVPLKNLKTVHGHDVSHDTSQRFWATPERFRSDTTREVMELRFNGERLCNYVSVEVSRYPHHLTIDLWVESQGRWVTVMTQDVIEASPAILRRPDPGIPFPQHPEGSPHWVKVSKQFRPPLRATRARITMVRLKDAIPLKDVHNNGVPWSLAARRFEVGMRISDPDDCPEEPGVISVTKDFQGSAVSYTLHKDTVKNLMHPLADNFWRCQPMPVSNAVASLFLDMRDDNGDGQVLDRFYLDPLYPGPTCHLYWSNDVPDGPFNDTNDPVSFDDLKVTGTVIPTTDGIVFSPTEPCHIEIHRRKPRLHYGKPWWVACNIRPGFSDSDPNHRHIFDFGGNRCEIEAGNVRFTSEHGETVSTLGNFQIGSALRIAIAYLFDNDDILTPRVHVYAQSAEGGKTHVSMPVSPFVSTSNAMRFGGHITSPQPPGHTLRHAMVKQKKFKEKDFDDFCDSPHDYCTHSEFHDHDDDDDAPTNGSVLRMSVEEMRLDVPFAFYGGPGHIYENMTWTPVGRDYSVQKGYMHVPPVKAKFWKLEFTNLVAQHFENFVPIRKRINIFPPPVAGQVDLHRVLSVTVTEPGADAFSTMTQQMTFSDAVPVQTKMISGTLDPSASPPTETLYSTDTENAAVLKQAGSPLSYQEWHLGENAPLFDQVSQHVYDQIEIEHSDKVAYFVGLKSIRAWRVRYDQRDDTQIYWERFLDDKHLKPGYTFTRTDTGLDSGSGGAAVAQGVAYESQTPVTAIQFATVQSDALQLLDDDSFVNPAKATYDWTNTADWHKVGDATLTYNSGQQSVRVDRDVSHIFVDFGHDPGIVLPPIHPTFSDRIAPVEDFAQEARLSGGIESQPIAVSPKGQVWAAVRFTVENDINVPWILRIIGSDGQTILAEKPIIGHAGQLIEETVGYTLGSYAPLVSATAGAFNRRDLVQPLAEPLAHPDALVASGSVTPFTDIDNTVTVQLVQFGPSNNSITIDRMSLFEDSILWEFSNDGGTTFQQAIAIRNNPNGVMRFANGGTLLVWRATSYRPNRHIASIQIRPWYGKSLVERKRRMRWGPNLSAHDQYPPITDDPEFRMWHHPVPYWWWNIARTFPIVPPEGAPMVNPFSVSLQRTGAETPGSTTDSAARHIDLFRTATENIPLTETLVSNTYVASSPNVSHLTSVPQNAVHRPRRSGDLSTWWQTVSTEATPTLFIDRGGSGSFSSVRMQWHSAGYQAIDYTIATSPDNSTWTTVVTVTGNTTVDRTDTFTLTSDRYVRVIVTARSPDLGDTYAHLALREFSVG
jgi:hypothetical protein